MEEDIPEAELASLRADLDSTIQKHPPFSQTALLTGWVLVAEFMDTDGKRWLSRADSEGMTVWLRKGLLHDALFEDGTWEPDGTDP